MLKPARFLLAICLTKATNLIVNYHYSTDFPGPGSTASRRPVQGFATITYADAMGNSEYEALQMRVQRRYSNGISLPAD
jgi:hypothetical protein